MNELFNPAVLFTLLSTALALILAGRLRRRRNQVDDSRSRAVREGERADRESARAERRAQRLDALLDATDDAVLRVLPDLTIRAASPACKEILARDVDDLLGRPLIEATVDHRLEELAREALNGSISRGEISLRDLRPGHSDEMRHVQVTAAPDGDDGAWILLRDLTEIVRLRQIRTEFVDNLSHELRTPLSTIRLLAESIATAGDRGDASGAKERAAQIEVEVLHLVQMADEMLDLATLEAGEVALRSTPVDLLELARDVSTRFAPVATRHGGDILVEESGIGPWVVPGDRDRLRQVLANLVHNGVKYSRPEGRVTIRLSRAAAADPNPYVEIQVSDEGIGIERRHLSRIFERFYTVERIANAAPSVGGAGTGLGLAIARHAILRHGGSIEVDSTVGVGTTFTIRLPLR
ncbi:MAG: sensor histidine kinase [Candidatus Limnocylindrus sp.]|jgi:two-component system phosphate regulon sensor histidine kinase PhoR